MISDNPRDKLDPNSRMNYAKVYTVEHNVKVLFIGRIAPKYEQQVVIDYNHIHSIPYAHHDGRHPLSGSQAAFYTPEG
jgi:hypothetical protein